MSEFAERFERGTEVIHQRLLRVERQAQDLPESVPEPAAGIDQPLADTPPAPSAEVAPPLDWDIELPAVEAARRLSSSPSPSSPSSVSRRSSLTPSLHANPRWSSVVSRAAGWVRRQHGIAHRRGAAVHRPGLSLRYARNGWRCRGVPLRRGGAGSDGAARRRLVVARAARRLRPDPARHRYRGAVPTIFAAMRLHPLISRRGAGPDDLLGDPRRAAERHGPGGGGGARRLRRADPDLHRQRQHVALFSYFALLNAGIFAIAWSLRLAAAQPGRLRRHLRHRFRLGTALLYTGAVRQHRAVPWPCSS